MVIKKQYSVCFLLLLGLISVQSECHKRLDCSRNVYNFEVGIKAYPDKDSINIGDTIWFEVNQPTTLKNTGTGTLTDYSKAVNLGSFLGFSKLIDTAQKWTDAENKFNLKLINGTDITNAHFELGHEYRFIEVNQQYSFLLQVIPKETGIYSILFSNASNVYRSNDKCTKASFTLNFKSTNQHYYLNPYFTGGQTPVGGDYYFKVY